MSLPACAPSALEHAKQHQQPLNIAAVLYDCQLLPCQQSFHASHTLLLRTCTGVFAQVLSDVCMEDLAEYVGLGAAAPGPLSGRAQRRLTCIAAIAAAVSCVTRACAAPRSRWAWMVHTVVLCPIHAPPCYYLACWHLDQLSINRSTDTWHELCPTSITMIIHIIGNMYYAGCSRGS